MAHRCCVTPRATQTVRESGGQVERCAAFVYRRGSHGWQFDSAIYPPQVGPEGASASEACRNFGIEAAISNDGRRAAVLSSGRVDIYARESDQWALERELALPVGTGCTGGIAPRRLAMDGGGETLIAAQPNCQIGSKFQAGRAYAYTRGSAGWEGPQVLEAPTPEEGNEFGKEVAISDDGSTATVGTGRLNAGLPPEAGAAWPLARGSTGWTLGTRLAAPLPHREGGLACTAISSGGARIVCSSRDSAGSNARQGSLYAFERPSGGWSATPAAPIRVFAADGVPFERLGISTTMGWPRASR